MRTIHTPPALAEVISFFCTYQSVHKVNSKQLEIASNNSRLCDNTYVSLCIPIWSNCPVNVEMKRFLIEFIDFEMHQYVIRSNLPQSKFFFSNGIIQHTFGYLRWILCLEMRIVMFVWLHIHAKIGWFRMKERSLFDFIIAPDHCAQFCGCISHWAILFSHKYTNVVAFSILSAH